MQNSLTFRLIVTSCVLCSAVAARTASPMIAHAAQTAKPAAAQSPAVATVNGEQILGRDLTASKPRVEEVQKLISTAGKDQLDVWIKNRLLQQEIQKRGLSYNKLIQDEVVGKTSSPTEEEARQYYSSNRKLFVGEYEAYRDYIIEVLERANQQKRLDAYLAELRGRARVQVHPAGAGSDATRVLASVNEEKVTSAELEDTVKQYVFSLQAEIYNAQLSEVESQVAEKLIEQEAKRRSVPKEQLIEQEITSKARKITDDDVVRFFIENGSQINEPFERVKSRIAEYLRQEALQQARDTLVETLYKQAKVSVLLAEPEPPLVHLSDVADISIGSLDAPITIVEFTDYQCPTCANAHPIVDQVLKTYGSKVRLVLRNLPLYIHANAPKAAEAAHCAAAQGKYREYSDLLYQNQNELDVRFLKIYAEKLGLDRAKFNQELDSGKYASLVKRDMEEADRLNVHSTPTFFVNKRLLSTGISFESFQKRIDRELEQTAGKKS